MMWKIDRVALRGGFDGVDTPVAAATARKMAVAETATTWSLTAEERATTVQRVAKNISTLAFFRGQTISDDAARLAAAAAEKKAYTAALVAARTTTGARPAAETTSAYARCGIICSISAMRAPKMSRQ